MRNFLLGLFVALAVTGFAVTDNPDGSVTFTHEEAQNMLDNFNRMDADGEQYAKDRATALLILQRMQVHINELEARKCL